TMIRSSTRTLMLPVLPCVRDLVKIERAASMICRRACASSMSSSFHSRGEQFGVAEVPRLEQQRQRAAVGRVDPGHARRRFVADDPATDAESGDDRAGGLAAGHDE